MKKLLLLLSLSVATTLSAQLNNNDVIKLGSHMDKTSVRSEIRIPMVNGLYALKCDLHSHTLFSDGQVWPSLRVTESWEDGLDAIAITDHIEYRPYQDVLKGDLNRANEIATEAAKDLGIIVIKGTEITRAKPLGHLNALFIEDANLIKVDDELAAIDAALAQGAFIQWNHPGWPDDKCTLYPVHEALLKEGKIHGVEVGNMVELYPASFDWCSKYGIAPVSNSDIHGLIESTFGEEIRPLTIVFAKEKSSDAIKEALFAKRTLAYMDGKLVGDAKLLKDLISASLDVQEFSDGMVEVYNNSDITYTIKNSDSTIHLYAGKSVRLKKVEGDWSVVNCYTGADKFLVATMSEIF